MKVHTRILLDENDFSRIERWLVHEVVEDKMNYDVCRQKAETVLSAMLNEAFSKGIEHQKKMQSCVD
jgi:hypothetical protein